MPELANLWKFRCFQTNFSALSRCDSREFPERDDLSKRCRSDIDVAKMSISAPQICWNRRNSGAEIDILATSFRPLTDKSFLTGTWHITYFPRVHKHEIRGTWQPWHFKLFFEMCLGVFCRFRWWYWGVTVPRPPLFGQKMAYFHLIAPVTVPVEVRYCHCQKLRYPRLNLRIVEGCAVWLQQKEF